jgi:hypothetical protein
MTAGAPLGTMTPAGLHDFSLQRVSPRSMPANQSTSRRPGPVKPWLVALFLISLAFINPWIRGDGVGYYAYVRSLLIEHNLNFEADWLHANPSFREGRIDSQGHILAGQYTATCHLANLFSVGPSLLWSPFLLLTHGFVISADRLGFDIPADGFSRPYRIAMALSTAFYGFLGLLLAFDLARQYFHETWAFLATLSIWFASSLPVYMYFNPSWSHAHSAFAVGLFLWYWNRTRARRSLPQWVILAAMSGLMINIYYLNAIFLLVIGWEAITTYRQLLHSGGRGLVLSHLSAHVLFGVIVTLTLAPTLVTRWLIYGSIFESGYPPLSGWSWNSPKIGAVLFSADHGMLSWTPVLLPALVGLICFSRKNLLFGGSLLSAFLVYLYCVASYPDWDGLSSFGNRFFVSFTPVFIIGLASLLENIASRFQRPAGVVGFSGLAIAALIAWNFGLMLQWGTQMIPARGAISWPVTIQNQFIAVPEHMVTDLSAYFANRALMMEQIEERDTSGRQK